MLVILLLLPSRFMSFRRRRKLFYRCGWRNTFIALLTLVLLLFFFCVFMVVSNLSSFLFFYFSIFLFFAFLWLSAIRPLFYFSDTLLGQFHMDLLPLCIFCHIICVIVSYWWIHSFFYKHTGKLGWSSICLRFSQFEPEIVLDGMLNFKTHFRVWYCVWYEHCNGFF